MTASAQTRGSSDEKFLSPGLVAQICQQSIQIFFAESVWIGGCILICRHLGIYATDRPIAKLAETVLHEICYYCSLHRWCGGGDGIHSLAIFN